MLTETSKRLREAMLVAVQNPKPLDADAQRGAWLLGERTKDLELLSALAARADLPGDVLSKARDRSEIPIRIAYLTRTDLTRKEFNDIVENETRAGVLAGVCEAGGLENRPGLADILLARMAAKPTRALAEAVLQIDDAPAALYAKCLIVMAEKSDMSDALEHAMRARAERVAEDPAAAAEVILTISRPKPRRTWARTLVAAPGLPAETRKHILDNWIVPSIREDVARSASGGSRHYSHEYAQLVAGLLNAPDLSAEFLGELRSALAPVAAHQGGLMNMLNGYDPDGKADEARARLRTLETARCSTDESELHELAKAAARDPQLCDALLENPALTGVPLYAIAARAAAGDVSRAQRLLNTYAGDETLAATVYAATPEVALHDKWQSFAEPEQARKELIKALADADVHASQPHVRIHQFRSLVDVLDADDPALLEVPWSVLNGMLGSWSRSWDSCQKLCQALAAEQARVLGPNPEKWETMAVLAQEFHGSLKDLVAASAAV